MQNSTTPVTSSGATRKRAIIDILIVIGAALGAYALEGLASARGLLNVGEAARGASSMPVAALTTLALVRFRKGAWSDLGFKRPERWSTVPLWVAGILGAFVAGETLVPKLVSVFIDLPEPDFSRYAEIAGNLPAAVAMSLVLPLTASIPEEIVFRGFFVGRFETLFGGLSNSALLAVLAQAAVFSLVHFSWGVGGMLMTAVMGLVWGVGYLLCGRNLWVVILAHSAGHILLVTGLYFADPITL
jgi:membrane protease YdiL (CAAX protease family)